MVIKVNESTSYEFVSAKRENGQIVGTLADGSEIILGGDIPGIDDLIPQEPSTDERIAVLEEQIVQADETAIALYEAQEAKDIVDAQQDEALMEIYEMIG